MSTTGASSGQSLIQNIKFVGSESEYVTELHGQVVNVQCAEGNHNHGSSKVKLIDRIDYNWELKYYRGHLVAAHISGKIIAYAMKGKDGGMIRVVHQDTNVKRTLIKNLKDDIKDLAFAYSTSEVILACVDCEGNILVYNIEDSADSLNYTLLLHVFHEEGVRQNTNFRLAWCPFVGSVEEEVDLLDEPEKMFVILNGTKAEIYNVATLNSKYGNQGPIDPDSSFEGYTEIIHTSDLVDASFSSDGCAIALACQDGFVKFFQLFLFVSDFQKCIHEWIPHGGKPLTSVIFVDNILKYTSQCWKFAVTGANNNTELKLWSCESWTCLQTINFLPNPKSIIPDLFLNVSTDYTGKYLVISDINNRAIYVLELQKDEKEELITAGILANFLVPAPFLSFHILEAGTRNFPYCYNNSSDDLYDENGEEFEDEVEISVQALKMLVIQPKKFQECNIIYQPDTLMYDDVLVTENVVDDLVDLKNDGNEEVAENIPELEDLHNSVTLLIQQQQNSSNNSKLTLMTPDAFTSPNKNNSKSSSVRNSITNEIILIDTTDKKLNETEFQRPQRENYASAGSSPSREVQEILSLNNSSTGYPAAQEYFNNLASLQAQEDEEAQPQKDFNAPTEASLLYQDQLNWPKISLVKESETAKQIQEVNDINDLNKQDLETVYLRMNGLENLVREQSVMLGRLHEDLKILAVQHQVTKNVELTNDINSEQLAKELEAAMSKQQLQFAKMLENLVQLQKAKDRELQENLANVMSQILAKAVSEKVPQIVQHEIKHTVLPSLHQTMESYRLQIENQFSHKFTNMDSMVKEQLSKVLGSKSLVESLSVSVANLIAPGLEKSYREIIAHSLLPSWEKICSQMFHQINDAFSRGTKEYVASVEAYMEKQRRFLDKGKDMVGHMQVVSENLKSTSDKLADTLSVEIQKQIGSVFKSMQEKLSSNMKEVVSSELKHGFKTQAATIQEGVLNAVNRSRAVTPAPHSGDSNFQLMAHIQQALTKGAYAEAFQVALSAENLHMVIYVCEHADVNKVFGEQCLLSQSVLLALIQQLSMEFHKNTETKLSFIRAAFLALTPDAGQTKQFVPKVLRDLLKQLVTFMQSNPPLRQMTEARLLKMAVESMLMQHFRE
ncbi:enhancer of mRNA-decapping protein 4 homolog [Euwallacea similis]|uniref:enhancer of mRNA-decapping protein 4 homolog n=1 Tax=Euwallacea similis TaxID=1736056 RepID=UPI00344E2E30